MVYLDPTDAQTMRRIGINVGALFAITMVLVAIVAIIT